MHDIGIVLACENVSSTTHISCQLVDLVKPTIDDGSGQVLITKITEDEIVRLTLGIFVEFQINSPDPKSLTFQPFYQMSTNETSGSQDQRMTHLE
jgi:hypothetical protein